MSKLAWLSLLLLSLGLASCSPGLIPLPSPEAEPTGLPATEVTFLIQAPASTPADAQLSVLFLDPITGLDYHASRVPMQRREDGRWVATAIAPVGSMLYYRYERLSPSPAVEVTGEFRTVPFRAAHVPGPLTIKETVAGWSDEPYADATGRILGHITDLETGEGLAEILVAAGGAVTFTDAEGAFRLDGLVPGEHLLVAFGPDGSYKPQQQGAVVSAAATTPVELALQPAIPVHVTFQVTVPPDTPAEAELRLAGSLAGAGRRFAELRGGLQSTAVDMPAMVRVDPSHFLAVLQFYEGSDLRYRYTLGDGIWNAERSADGGLVTRQLIIPKGEPIVRDVVTTWRSGADEPATFHFSAPPGTPDRALVGIQFSPNTWYEPIPMWHAGENRRTFALYNPLPAQGSLSYRYCLNLACERTGDTRQSLQAPFSGTTHDDGLSEWPWPPSPDQDFSQHAAVASSRALEEAGAELLPAYDASWKTTFPQALEDLSSMHANTLVLSPRWIWQANNPFPRLEFDPARAPFKAELQTMAALAQAQGLQVVIHPTLGADEARQSWWAEATRDPTWWDHWFSEYRSLLLTYAHYAQMAGASELVIGDAWTQPALPGGHLPEGGWSDVPENAEARWREMIQDVREVFDGRIALEIEVSGDPVFPPPLLDAVDQVHLYWHAPLSDSDAPTLEEMARTAGLLLDSLIASGDLAGLPVVLSVEYLSIPGSARACTPGPGGECRPASDLEAGFGTDLGFAPDSEAQLRVYAALLEAIGPRADVVGFLARRYDPALGVLDGSASVRGKAAEALLRAWFAQATAAP